MRINSQQKKQITALDTWFSGELARLRDRRLAIMKKYEKKKNALLEKKLEKEIQNI